MSEFNFSLDDKEFKIIKDLVYSKFGIHLTEQKRNLVQTRLQGVLRKLSCYSFKDYCSLLQSSGNEHLSVLVDRISTNFTYFWREEDHFNYLYDTVFPWIKGVENDSKNIRLWCAGCATGEEPYTIVMLMRKFWGVDYSSWSGGILATDISSDALSYAKKAVYQSDRIDRLPDELKNKNFEVVQNSNNEKEYLVKKEITSDVTFRRFNLMNTVFPFKKKFHAILCRNVMIYFDKKTREELVQKYYENLEVGGYLFIGHSESLNGLDTKFEYVMPAVYQKVQND